MLKDPSRKIYKAVRDFSKHLKYLYLLSGKPAPNHILEYFPQMKLIDPKTFSTSNPMCSKLIKKVGTYGTDYFFNTKEGKREAAVLIVNRIDPPCANKIDPPKSNSYELVVMQKGIKL